MDGLKALGGAPGGAGVMRRRLLVLGVFAMLAAAGAAASRPAVGAAAAASRPVAYCSLPAGPASPSWAFHAGMPVRSASGSYVHGHGTFSGAAASGQICQVIRVPGSPDRQIILTATHAPASIQPRITVGGVLGNGMRLQVRVSSSTDRKCRVGTRGKLTLFASYNGPRHDTIQLAFAKSCRRDSHLYRGPAVIVLVPR